MPNLCDSRSHYEITIMHIRIVRASLISIAILFCLTSGDEQLARAQTEAKNEEVLTPLTDDERSLNPRDIVLHQPDFVADLTFFRHRTVSGGGGSERIARKGNRYRKESQFWVFIGEQGKPEVRLFPERKAYDDMETTRDESATGFTPFDPRTLALEPEVSFKALGTLIIDGHRCIKIEAKRKGKTEEIYLYAARDLKNLIIAAQISNPPLGYIQRLSNISLEVPVSLVEVPPDYKPVEHDRWTKLETARVKYKGRPSKDFGVFRAPGGQLFVWINDAPYAWHYLVRPSEATVETAFQGLLVTRGGEWVWQTKESEAFSLTHYRKPRKLSDFESPEDKKVIVNSNSVKFRSNDYKKDKGIIEVSW